MMDSGFTRDYQQDVNRAPLAVDKASTISGVQMDQHCGKYHRRPCNICEHLTPAGAEDDEICGGHDKRPCDICEGLAVHPDPDPEPAPRTIEEARAAGRQKEKNDCQKEMSRLHSQMNLMNRRWNEEFATIREALHFQQVSETMKKRIRKQKAEGQDQSMKRRATKHAQEFSDIQRRLKTEELYLIMKQHNIVLNKTF